MGKLVWAAIGAAAAALAAEYFLPVSGLPYFAAALAVFSLFGLLLKGARRRNAMTLVLSGAAILLMWWGRYVLLAAPWEARTGEDVLISARVTEYPEEGDGYTGLSIRITSGGAAARGYLYVYDDSVSALKPGDEIRVEVRVLSVMENAAGQRRHTHTAQGRGFLGRIQGDVRVTGRWAMSWLYFPQNLAKQVGRLCTELFPEDVSALMRALLIGDKTELYADADTYAAMRSAGVLHIVAVSGMHIVILVSMLRLLLGRGRKTALACLPLMLVFVFMAGAGSSVVRASLMQTMVLMAPLLKREHDWPAALAAALLILLILNPMAIGGTAFQLSFSCVLGFVVFMPRIDEWCVSHLPIRYMPVRLAAASVSCTLCATVFSLPLSAYYFGVIPLFSWLSNLLTLFAVELLFAGGYVVCLLGILWAPLGHGLGWLLAWIVRYCVGVWSLLGRLPFACLYTVSGGAVTWLAGMYALWLIWLLLGRRRGLRALIPGEVSLLWLCVVLLAAGGSISGGAITVLDVGQGACAALLGEDAAVLVDCGGTGMIGAGDLAADYLLSQGRTRVDALILTHLHEDHVNGVPGLLARLPVSCIILPADHDDGDGMLEEILAAAERHETAVLFLAEEGSLELGELSLTLLLPRAGTDENERGIAVLAQLADMRCLLMGDAGQAAETELLERGVVPDVDLLAAGHHGSKTASGLLFLRAADPETAIISVGAGNTYGLPAQETLDRMAAEGISVLRTDIMGNITIVRKADRTDG